MDIQIHYSQQETKLYELNYSIHPTTAKTAQKPKKRKIASVLRGWNSYELELESYKIIKSIASI